MANGKPRPKGGRPGGRRGGAGVGPGPAYRPGNTGGGTSHKGGNPPRTRRSPMDSGNDKSCCYGAAAVKSARRGKFRLARRYSILCFRSLAGI